MINTSGFPGVFFFNKFTLINKDKYDIKHPNKLG